MSDFDAARVARDRFDALMRADKRIWWRYPGLLSDLTDDYQRAYQAGMDAEQATAALDTLGNAIDRCAQSNDCFARAALAAARGTR